MAASRRCALAAPRDANGALPSMDGQSTQ